MVSSCAARAALAGNPSDAYGGAVVATPIFDLQATASAVEADHFEIHASDRSLERLLEATAAGYIDARGELPPVRLSASTAIPRSVGLGGSSALVVAALRALGGWAEHRWDVRELAHLALSIERDRLGITAGLQDRLVQAVGRLVAMTFDPVGYTVLDPEREPPLFVAWSIEAAETSDTLHRSLRRRFDRDDPAVANAMVELATQAHRARHGIETGDLHELGAAIDRTFEIRASIVDVGDRQRELVEIGRRHGAFVNSAGSGGSVVGLVIDDEIWTSLRTDYERIGATFLELV